MTSAVVFAYHDVGVRCLHVLLAAGLDVRLVVTHRDDPRETIWFESVERLAQAAGINVITPEDAASTALMADVNRINPDFIFSFYYRHMLPVRVLELAKHGAYNMHGSLLPKYRGRVPINWAIVHGERETGASLHEMVAQPDAGGVLDQQAVPILPNDRALDVFRKVTLASEQIMLRSLPRMIDRSITPQPQNLAAGAYFGGRTPADGRIDWRASAPTVHNVIRAVAPPYPGAFADTRHGTLRIDHSYYRGLRSTVVGLPAITVAADELQMRCHDGGILNLLAARLNDQILTPAMVREHGELLLEPRPTT